MASTFSTNLAIELIGTGDQAGTWGVTTNTNLGTLIEQAISGYVTQAVSTGSDTTITIPNGATGVARNMYIELTGTGGTNTNLIVPSNKKLYFIFNNTSSGQVTVKVSGQTGVSVPNGKKMILVCNGTDVVNGLNYIADFGTNSFTVTNLTASSGTITNLIATTGTITTLSATSGNISNLVSSDASATVLRAGSATLTHLSATSASITNLTLTSLVISNLSIASANITTLTSSSATISTTLALSGGTANGVLYLNGSKVATSGSALTFDGTNLGLGTSNPSGASGTAFVVNGGAGQSRLALKNTNSGDASTDGFQIALLSDGINVVYQNRESGYQSWELAGTEGMRLTSTGLGIGTSSPATAGSGYTAVGVNGANGSNLALNGGGTNIGLIYAATGNSNLYVTNQTASGNLIFGAGSGAEQARIDSSGNLGIGTSSPASRLDVRNTGGTYDKGISVQTASGGNIGTIWTSLTDLNIGIAGAHKFTNYDGSATRMTLDSSGNLGLGVTPSAWGSPFKAIEGGDSNNQSWIGFQSNADAIKIGANCYYDGANYKYKNTAAAGFFNVQNNIFSFDQAASGTAGNNITFTTAMTLDANGRLFVGTTSGPSDNNLKINLGTTSSSTDAFFSVAKDSGYGLLLGYSYGAFGYLRTVTNEPLLFGTNNTERARITSGGDFNFGVAATNAGVLYIQTGTGGTTGRIIDAINAVGGRYFEVQTDGDVYNTNGTYGTISDAKMKTDIVDAGSQWADIKAIRFRKFKMKNDPSGLVQLGVVAQELEQTSPGLVDEHTDRDAEGNDLGTTTKSVKTSILLMKAAKALQEAMARIEQLEAKVAALETK